MDDLSKVVQQLSKEAAQETAAKTGTGSYLAEANAEMLRSRELEFSDSEKQWVRSHIWLKVVSQIAEHNQRQIRYLTLPAYHRLDVTLFDHNGLLQNVVSVGGHRILEVAAFESDPAKFGRMSSQVPQFRLLGQCGIEQAITDAANPYFEQLAAMFPFDVVNMDLTSSLTPKREGPYSTTMRALVDILRRQVDHIGRWALFLTFRNMAPEWEPNAVNTLTENLEENIKGHPEVRDAFSTRYSVVSAADLRKKDEVSCLSQSVVKWMTDRAHEYHLNLVDLEVCQYRRYPSGVDPYFITKHVYTFERGAVGKGVLPTKGVPKETWMIQDLVACISKHRPKDVEEILYKSESAKPGVFDALRKQITSLIEASEENQSGTTEGQAQ